MNISSGTLLGRYEICALIGAGGMGQVYRAKDSALGREVAIKVLKPEVVTDADRLHRFQQEARAASVLNHPNILVIFDFGTIEGAPYVVSELLEGETLSDRLLQGPIPARKSVDYAMQIARGLAAAHGKGIVHRDLKPDNLFVTKDGVVKILDFGLAKLLDPVVPDDASSEAQTKRISTIPGMVMGTIGYMSPEQVRGQNADHRSDIFSFGAVFYEMLIGERAFRRESSVETMNAILKEDPQPSTVSNRTIPPALDRVIRHCLEKQPEDRFQSARDLAFDLESMSGLSDVYTRTATDLGIRSLKSRLPMKPLLIGAAVVALLAAAFFLGRTGVQAQLPSYTQLTFRRGTVYSARFASDGHTILFSARWNGKPIDIYSMRSEAPASQSMGMVNARVLAVSSTGEMAVLLNSVHLFHSVTQGTLARMPIGGGAAREMLENVQEADWSADGANLAVVRFNEVQNQLEYPIGKVLYVTNGYISNPRVSPKGDMVAFLDHPIHGDNRGSVVVVDLNGKKKNLSGEWSGEDGLAWSHAGDEIWFTATKTGEAQALYAVTLSGEERVVARAPISLRLHDISHDGQVLLSGDNESTPIMGLAPNEATERDLSWLNWVRINDLSNDGKTFIFSEFGQGSGANYAIHLGKTDGAPAVRLGDGFGLGMSPDGKLVIAVLFSPPQLVLLPTGAGQAKPLERFTIEQYGYGAAFLPDGKDIVFFGREAGHAQRSYVQNIDGSPPRAVTPEGLTGTLVSPDGKLLLARDREEKKAPVLYPLEGGEARSIPGLDDQDRVIRWGNDGRSLYVYRSRDLPLRLFRLDVSTGRREALREISPPDPAGIRGTINVLVTPDGKGYVYAFTRSLSDLYLVSGLK